ncbi:RabC/Rab18 [Haematococcus lacustris]
MPAFVAPNEASSDCQHLIKVIFVGAAGVGKTCLIERLFTNKFDSTTQPTIGVDFRFKRYTIDNKSVGVTLWDTAGAERFAALTSSYFRGAHGIVLVYDVTRPETLEALRRQWLPEVERHQSRPDVVRLIVGNKVDMAEERMVSKEQGVEFAREHGCMYHETSACTSDDNVHDALVWGLVAGILDNEELVRAYHHDKLEVEGARRVHAPPKMWCCQ